MSDLRLRARSVTELVDAAFQLYRRDALEYILVTAVTYAPLLAAQLMVVGGTGFMTPNDLATRIGPLWVALLVLGIAGYAVMTAVVSKYSSDVYLGGAPDLGAVIRTGFRKILPLVGAWILLALLMAIGAFVVVAALSLGGPVLAVVGGFGALAWMIYAFARFVVVLQVIILEDRGVIDAMARAGTLSRGQKGHILLTFLLVGIVALVVMFAVMSFATISGSTVAAGFAQMIYTIIAYPLIGIVQMVLYYDLRIRAEGFDIEVMTAALGGETAPPAPHTAS